MKSCTKPHSITSTNPRMNGGTKGYKDGGYVMKPEDYVDVEGREAAEKKIRDEQIKADAERIKKLYPEKKK